MRSWGSVHNISCPPQPPWKRSTQQKTQPRGLGHLSQARQMASGRNMPVSLFKMGGTSYWSLETTTNSRTLSVTWRTSSLKSRPALFRLTSQHSRIWTQTSTTTLWNKLMTWIFVSYLQMRAVSRWALWALSQLFISKICLMLTYTTLQWCTKCSCLGLYKSVPSWDSKVVWSGHQASLKFCPCQDSALSILLPKRCQAT